MFNAVSRERLILFITMLTTTTTTMTIRRSPCNNNNNNNRHSIARRRRPKSVVLCRDDDDDDRRSKSDKMMTTRKEVRRGRRDLFTLLPTVIITSIITNSIISNKVTRTAEAAENDVVIIEAPRGYAYEMKQIITKTNNDNGKDARKIWFDDTNSSLLSSKYKIEFPYRFAVLEDLNSARSVGVDFSSKDPSDEASTLAIFVQSVKEKTLEEKYEAIEYKAKQIAQSAKNQRTIRTEKYRTTIGLNAWEIETEVGGGTAGRFGAAIELISFFFVQTNKKENYEVLIRATASLSSWIKVREELRECVRTFEFV